MDSQIKELGLIPVPDDSSRIRVEYREKLPEAPKTTVEVKRVPFTIETKDVDNKSKTSRRTKKVSKRS